MAPDGRIAHLTDQHRKLEEILAAEMSNPDWDQARVAALKKQKLRIKDALERLKSIH